MIGICGFRRLRCERRPRWREMMRVPCARSLGHLRDLAVRAHARSQHAWLCDANVCLFDPGQIPARRCTVASEPLPNRAWGASGADSWRVPGRRSLPDLGSARSPSGVVSEPMGPIPGSGRGRRGGVVLRGSGAGPRPIRDRSGVMMTRVCLQG